MPMENGAIALVRASGSTELSASERLVTAMNPCPCGAGNSKKWEVLLLALGGPKVCWES